MHALFFLTAVLAILLASILVIFPEHRRSIGRAVALLAFVLLAPAAALAQAAAPASSGSWADVWMPLVLTIAVPLLYRLIDRGLTLLERWTGIQMEAKDREAIHSAAMTGVNVALAKYGPANALTDAVRQTVISEALNHVVTTGAPDAAAKFGADAVQKVVEGKLGALVTASATVGVTTGAAPAGA